MPSDLEMSDSSQSDSEPNTDVAYRRGPPHLMHKGNLHTRKEHQDNTRAYSKASIIWQFGDEYARTVNGQQKKYWRCGLCDRTTILVMSDNSSSGLRHLKKNHKIDKDGQRQTSPGGKALVGVVFHYLSDDLKVRNLLVGMRRVEGSQPGENIAEGIIPVIQAMGVVDRLWLFIGDNICGWIDGTVLRISWAWYLEAFRFFNLGFLREKPLHPTVPDSVTFS
jgi:hypothetical protein